MKPSLSEIAAEIKTLVAMKPKVLRQSAFGDDHHDAIDAQIEVLTDLTGTGETFFDEEAIEEESDARDWEMNVRESALEAYRWTEGESKDGPPSENWKSLVR